MHDADKGIRHNMRTVLTKYLNLSIVDKTI
jgi:hypothetical protein